MFKWLTDRAFKKGVEKAQDIADECNSFEENVECQHDWEVVREFPGFYAYYDQSFLDNYKTHFVGYNTKIEDPLMYWETRGCHRWFNVVSDKVCLNCGECHNGLAEMQAWFASKAIKDRDDRIAEENRTKQRKQLARKMWAECKE